LENGDPTQQGSPLMGVDRPDGSWTARNLIFFEGKSAPCGASLDPSTHEITLQPGFYVLEGFGVGREVDSFELAFSLWRTEYEPLRLRAHRLGFRGSASPSRTPWRTSFRLEQWNRKHPNGYGFGWYYHDALVDSSFTGSWPGDLSLAQLRIERLSG
jgi:hypothetical protein